MYSKVFHASARRAVASGVLRHWRFLRQSPPRVGAAEADDEDHNGEDVEEGKDRGDRDGEAGAVGPDAGREGHGEADGHEEDDGHGDEEKQSRAFARRRTALPMRRPASWPETYAPTLMTSMRERVGC